MIAGTLYRSAGAQRREVVALCSCTTSLGLLGVVTFRSERRPRADLLRLALRRWNGCGMKINIGRLSLLLAAFSLTARCAEITPLPRAHAHNDYEHRRPLFDALDHGFCSVEADIWLVDGQLLVAHDRDKVDPQRTLQKLYLDPLVQRVKRHGGKVYPNGPPFLLLVDIKSEAESTAAALGKALRGYREMLTVFSADSTRTGAVTIVLSGNRPAKALIADTERVVALDGRLPDLEANPSRHLVPLVSDNWTRHFKWRGRGPLPDDERSRLKALVDKAHQQGRLIRFWATPDNPEGWVVMRDAGVDLINTDDLPGLGTFLRSPATR